MLGGEIIGAVLGAASTSGRILTEVEKDKFDTMKKAKPIEDEICKIENELNASSLQDEEINIESFDLDEKRVVFFDNGDY